MKSAAEFIAVDLGASGGRVMAGRYDSRHFLLREVHRFPNAGVAAAGSLYWDVLGLWSQMLTGFAKYHAACHESPAGIGIDAWGVDFALLDSSGKLLGNPLHYRDARTEGLVQKVFARCPESDLFAATGTQAMQINTLFQLYSMVLDRDGQLGCAATLLTIPDLFLYFLSGTRAVEFTEATTTQMYSPSRRDWAGEILEPLGIPLRILPGILKPGTVVGSVRPGILAGCGFESDIPAIAVASHDTASAVAAIPRMDEHSAFISSGTWSLMGVEVDQPNTSELARRLHFTNEGSAAEGFLLLKNITGLWLLQQCLQHWAVEGQAWSWSEVMDAASHAEPLRALCDPDDPRLQVQSDMPGAIRSYCRATHQPAPDSLGQFARFAFESLSLKYRSVRQALELLTGRELRTLRIVGGGSLNGCLCQMIADACGCTVVSGPAEASALGNIIMQAIATGCLSDLQAARAALAESVACTTFDPCPSVAWEEAYARFQDLEVD